MIHPEEIQSTKAVIYQLLKKCLQHPCDSAIYLLFTCYRLLFIADFTPSRGNTPVHPSLAGNLKGNGDAPASFQQSPPQEKKKRLSELFSESLRSELELNAMSTKKETAITGDRVPLRSTPGTPYVSVCNSERTPNGDLRCDVKSSKPAQCCLPRLLSSRSFSERRKRMSPARTVG